MILFSLMFNKTSKSCHISLDNHRKFLKHIYLFLFPQYHNDLVFNLSNVFSIWWFLILEVFALLTQNWFYCHSHFQDDGVPSIENNTLSNLRVSQTGSTIHLIGSEVDDPIYVNTSFVSELEETDVWFVILSVFCVALMWYIYLKSFIKLIYLLPNFFFILERMNF